MLVWVWWVVGWFSTLLWLLHGCLIVHGYLFDGYLVACLFFWLALVAYFGCLCFVWFVGIVMHLDCGGFGLGVCGICWVLRYWF